MQDIHGIRPPVPVGFDPAIFKIAAMVIGGCAVLALLFYVIKKWIKNRKQINDHKLLPAPLAPYDQALKDLELISQQGMKDQRLFYFNLTAVLRQYIGRSFHFNAVEMTSQEFVRSIKPLLFDKMIKKDILNFISVSDPVKYAGILPETNRTEKDFLRIKEMICQIENNLTIQKEPKEEAS